MRVMVVGGGPGGLWAAKMAGRRGHVVDYAVRMKRLPQDRMMAKLKSYGMILTAYCPVARGKLLDDPIIGVIAKARGKTPAQICLRWLIQQPMVAAVPRALEERHIVDNFDVFDFSLSDDEMRQISALRKQHIRIAYPPERADRGRDLFRDGRRCHRGRAYRGVRARSCRAQHREVAHEIDVEHPRPDGTHVLIRTGSSWAVAEATLKGKDGQKTLDLRGSRSKRLVVFSHSWGQVGTHVLEVRVKGTAGRPRVVGMMQYEHGSAHPV